MPVYNPEPDFLRSAVDSLLAQEHEEWELCMADDASTDPAIKPLLKELAASDPRIRVSFRSENGHISAATNTSLEMARYPYSALLDQDDMLTPDALAQVARHISNHPGAEVLYSDEIIIAPGRTDIGPYCKPGWDSELIYGQNYVSHLGVYLTSRLREIGGFRRGFEGAQDYDMLLRFTRGLPPEKIRHLPLTLYQWRSHEGSTASGNEAKSYAAANGTRALEEHLTHTGIQASVENYGTLYHVRYRAPSPMPLVSFIISCGDRPSCCQRLLKALTSLPDYPKVQLCVTHNSDLDSKETDAVKHLRAYWPKSHFMAFAAGTNEAERQNAGAKSALGKILVFLNGNMLPTVWSRGWLSCIAGHLSRPGMGAAGGRILYENGKVYSAGYQLDARGVLFSLFRGVARNSSYFFAQPILARSVRALHPYWLATPAGIFAESGGFNTDVGAAAAIDYCLRLHEASLAVAISPLADFILNDEPPEPSWETEGRVIDPAILKQLCTGHAPYHPRLVAHGTLWAYLNPETGSELPLLISENELRSG